MLKDLEGIIKSNAGDTGSPQYLGIAQLLKAYVVSTMVDLFGDIPYTEALNGDSETAIVNPNFEDDAAIYAKMLLLVDEGIKGVTNDQLLQTAASANNEWEKSFEGRAAIANTIINRMEKMGLSFDETMGSLAGSSVGATHESRMKSNWFTGYQELINAGNSGRNSNAVYRSCVSASLDAYGGGFDYSNGAIGWQGTDFFSSQVRGNGTHWPAYLKYKAKGFKPTKLSDCCREMNIKLNHHEALSDARACAKLYMLR